MHIQVQSGGDGRVTQDGGNRLIVAAALYATGGEGVPEGVETDLRDAPRYISSALDMRSTRYPSFLYLATEIKLPAPETTARGTCRRFPMYFAL